MTEKIVTSPTCHEDEFNALWENPNTTQQEWLEYFEDYQKDCLKPIGIGSVIGMGYIFSLAASILSDNRKKIKLCRDDHCFLDQEAEETLEDDICFWISYGVINLAGIASSITMAIVAFKFKEEGFGASMLLACAPLVATAAIEMADNCVTARIKAHQDIQRETKEGREAVPLSVVNRA